MSVSLATKLYGKKPAFFPFTKTVVPNDALPMRRTARGGISAGALHAVRHQRASVLPDAAAGVISGVTDTTLGPQGEATRAQVAVIVKNFIDKFIK